MLTVGDFSGAGKIFDRDSALPNLNHTFTKRQNLGGKLSDKTGPRRSTLVAFWYFFM